VEPRIHVDDTDPTRMALDAARLGYEVVVECVEVGPGNVGDVEWLAEEITSEVSDEVPPDVLVLPGCKLTVNDPGSLRRLVPRVRGIVYYLAVSGGDPAVNRAALSDPRVDALSHPEKGQPHAGFGKHEIELARRKMTYIEFELARLFRAEGEGLAWRVSRLRDALRMRRLKRFPMIVATGARDPLELVPPKQKEEILRELLGFEDEEVEEVCREGPIETLRWNVACKHVFVVPGVAVVRGRGRGRS